MLKHVLCRCRDAVQERDLSIHATLAVDFLKAVYSRKHSSYLLHFRRGQRLIIATGDERKRFCQLLGKLNLPEQLDPYILRNLTVLLKSIAEVRILFFAESFSNSASSSGATSSRHRLSQRSQSLRSQLKQTVRELHGSS